jgi:hypothetical protein
LESLWVKSDDLMASFNPYHSVSTLGFTSPPC